MNTVSLVAVAKFRLWEFRIKRRAHLNASNTDLKCCQLIIKILAVCEGLAEKKQE